MDFELHSKQVRITSRLRGHIEERLRSTVRRFRNRVGRIRVLLTDVNGPRGGEDIECHIHARLGGGGVVTIKEYGSDPYSAVARAAHRVRHQLARRLARASAERRGR